MPVIVVGAEKNFAALRSRLFGGSISTKAAGEVSAAIQEANPHADLKALQPGTVLVVPDDLPHVAVRGDLSLDDRSKEAAVALVTVGNTSLSDLKSSVQSRAAEAADARKQLARALAGKELAQAADRDPAVADSLKAARAAVAAADAEEKAREEALAAAQSEWSAELAALKQTLPS
jgi:hypothetical protein